MKSVVVHGRVRFWLSQHALKPTVAELGGTEGEEIIIDGSINFLDEAHTNVKPIIKADLTVPIVSAASVFAKVKRDKYMTKLHFEMPQYGFKEHVGYGTQQHIVAIKEHGVSKHHRKSFKPIANLIGSQPSG
jgi:ribonuclease HII